MNIKQLKDFRAKLAHAKALCSWQGYNRNITLPFKDAGLPYQCADAFKCYIPDDVYLWYVHPNRTPAERKTMWNNSIIAIDARIAKSK